MSCVTDWPPSHPERTGSGPLAPTGPVYPLKPGSHTMSHPSWGCWIWKTPQKKAATGHSSHRRLHYYQIAHWQRYLCCC